MVKRKYSKAIGFSHISCEALIQTIPKIWEKGMSKTQNFKFIGFLNISGEVEIHTIPKTGEK